MCESTAYYITDGKLSPIMENVIYAIPQDGGVFLEDILGSQKVAAGRLKEIKLLDHQILIEK